MHTIEVPFGYVSYDNHVVGQHGDVLPVLKESLATLGQVDTDFFVKEIDMGRTIGHTSCVETTDDDQIVYAQRVGRRGMTRFVVSRSMVPSSRITIILKHTKGFTYKLITAFIGSQAAREPWDPYIQSAQEQMRSNEFWRTHALVWGSQQVIGTPLVMCPW